MSQLIAFCNEKNLRYKIIDERKLKTEVRFQPKITLYNYQQLALEEIADEEYGVIVAPPGAGKTILVFRKGILDNSRAKRKLLGKK